MTLGEAVIFSQYNPQTGWTAEAYQLTIFAASGGIRFPFPEGDLVAEHRVPIHRLPEGPLALLCAQG